MVLILTEPEFCGEFKNQGALLWNHKINILQSWLPCFEHMKTISMHNNQLPKTT